MKQKLDTKIIRKKLSGICYGPFRDGQSPVTKIYPTTSQIRADLNILKKVLKKNGRIRIYYVTKTMAKIPMIAKKLGLQLLPSCWVDKNRWEAKNETDALIQLANSKVIERALVGDMALTRKALKCNELIEYIRKVKQATRIPVGTADHWRAWLKYPQLIDEVDFFSVGIPIYDEGVSVDRAIEYIEEILDQINEIAQGKHFIIDAGWPSKGEKIKRAVCSLENQQQFIIDFTKYCEGKNIEYLVFEAFDEKWKKTQDKVEAAAHYGIFDTKRKPKF